MPDPFDLPTGRAAVATLIATEGTSPKEAGAKMWVDAEGRILGAVTIGGCVDARVIEESARVLAEGRPALLEMSLGDEDAWALGMTCGGSIEVLIEPVNGAASGDPVAQAMRAARDEVEHGRRVVIVAPLDGRSDRLVVYERGQRAGTLGDPTIDALAMAASQEFFASGRSGTAALQGAGTAALQGAGTAALQGAGVAAGQGTAAGARHYFELHAPSLTLVVFGATHVAMPLVDMARVLGLRTVVVDGRDRFATRERFPSVDRLVVGMPSEIAEQLALGPQSLVVLLSHDYKYDLPVLRAVLASNAAYIGCLGSARRGAAMLEFLAEEGVAAEQLARVRIPVGLDIGAKSAAEIALSVLAEAVAVQRGRGGGAMRDRRRAGASGDAASGDVAAGGAATSEATAGDAGSGGAA